MTAPCAHARTGVVTSQQHALCDESYAVTPVCDLQECITDGVAWVERVSHKKAFHVRDEVAS